MKYIHKYIYKRTDHMTITVSGTNNKITYYIQAHYISLTKAF